MQSPCKIIPYLQNDCNINTRIQDITEIHVEPPEIPNCRFNKI